MVRRRGITGGVDGFTLIEMLVAGGIALTIGLAAATFYTHQTHFQSRYQRQKDMRTRLQLGMEILMREIRHAGYGLTDPLVYDPAFSIIENPCTPSTAFPGAPPPIFQVFVDNGICASVTPQSGGNEAPDGITIMQVGDVSYGTLVAPLIVGDATLTVTSPVAIALDLDPAVKTIISIDGMFAEKVTGIVPADDPNQYKITLSGPFHFPDMSLSEVLLGKIGEDQGFSSGHSVKAHIIPPGGVGGIVFKIGPNPAGGAEPALLRDNNLFVSGIEDMQVRYIATPGSLVGPGSPLEWDSPAAALPTNPFNKNAYLALRVSLVARVPDSDPGWAGGQRPPLEDRLAGAPNDNFRRAVLTRVVELRNDRCSEDSKECS